MQYNNMAQELTFLEIACKNGDIDVINNYIANNNDIHTLRYNYYAHDCTLLHIACHNGKLDIVKILIDNNVDINHKNVNGITCLACVCFSESHTTDIDIVNLLIEKGADIHCVNNQGDTLLMCVAQNISYKPEIAKILIGNGINVKAANKYGDTCLHMSFRYMLTKFLIENGADINAKNKDGRTPFHNACEMGSLEHIKLFIDNGANLNETMSTNNSTIAHYWASSRTNITNEMLEFLVKNGLNILQKNNNNDTPMDIARKMISIHDVNTDILTAIDTNYTNLTKLIAIGRIDHLGKLIPKHYNKRFYILSLIIQNDAFKHYIINKYINSLPQYTQHT